MLTSRLKARSSIPMLAIITSIAFAATPSLAADPWDMLARVDIEETIDGDIWRAEKTFPPELVAAAEGFEIEGFLVPILPEAYITTFLLVEDPADCPFCGSGGYGPTLEVHLKSPLSDIPEFTRVTVRGDLVLIEDPETTQSARLENAIPIFRD